MQRFNKTYRRHRLAILCSAFIGLQTGLMIPAMVAAEEQGWTASFTQGEAAMQQEKLADAEEYFRKALTSVQTESSKPGDKEKCMLKLATILSLRNRTVEAQAIYQELLGSLEKRYGSNSSQLAPILLALGSIQEAAGDHATAVSYYQRALRINEKHYGPYSPSVGTNLHQLARATFKSGNKVEAETHYKRAVAILSKDPSLNASRELQSCVKDYGDLLKGNEDSNRELINDFNADVLGKRQQPSQAPHAGAARPTGSAWQAESRFELNASRQSQTNEDQQVISRGIPQPMSDKSLAPAFKTLNDALVNRSRYEKGESEYKRMIASDVDALGPNHPSVANDLNGLAMLYVSQKKYADAEPLLTRALSIYQQVYGDDNLLTINATAALASVEFQLGQTRKAEELYQKALSKGQATLGPDSLETADILNKLAHLYFHQGKLKESCTMYGWAVSSTESAVGKNDPRLAACLKDYSQVLRSLGRTSEADAIESRADQITTVEK